MKVKDLMTQDPVVLGPEATLEEAARRILETRYGGFPVVDGEGKLLGVVQVEELLPHPENVPFSDVEALQLFGEWVGRGRPGGDLPPLPAHSREGGDAHGDPQGPSRGPPGQGP